MKKYKITFKMIGGYFKWIATITNTNVHDVKTILDNGSGSIKDDLLKRHFAIRNIEWFKIEEV